MEYDLVKCTRCKKVLIDEEYELHLCIPKTTGHKIIKIAYHFITKNDLGRTVIEAKGLDGITYELVDEPKDKVSFINRNFTVNKTTADLTEPVEIIFLFYEVV